jgi:hypothetical protein
MDWASGITGAQADDLLLSRAEIEVIVDGVMATMGTLHTDPSTLPTSSTARPRGAFADPNDMKQWLEDGGLITYDALGNPVPIPIVNILKQPQPDGDLIIYEVWIDENT